MKDVKFIILDEYSMIGKKMLAMIDKRCREATGKKEFFGGLTVLLFGDMRQLPPVKDTALYSTKPPTHDLTTDGRSVFNSFEKAVILSRVQRQNDVQLVSVLENMCSGTVTERDYKILETRFKSAITPAERQSFDNAIHLYPTKDQVREINLKAIRNLRCPTTKRPVSITKISAQHNCATASAASPDNANGLLSSLYLGIGMKVMCKANLWTSHGLVNASVGHVVDVVYDKDCSSSDSFPVAIICNFPSYKGPYINNDQNQKLVAIPPITASWTTKDSIACSRTQFPLVPSYACTIHKSQGITLDKVVVHLGKKEMAAGLSYVAISRVKSLKGLLLYDFPLSRLLKINKSKSLNDRRKLQKLLQDNQL